MRSGSALGRLFRGNTLLPVCLFLSLGCAPGVFTPPQDVVIAVGDIAVCELDGDERTSQLGDLMRAKYQEKGSRVVVITTGDNVYPRGTMEQYMACYAPSWGRPSLLSVTRPSPGNHDYLEDGTAAPYFAYFGERAGPAGLGYYSYEVGPWHLISLNSELAGAAAARQLDWLKGDLQAHPVACTLAYWHKPVFSSGQHGNNPVMAEAWSMLHGAAAEVVVNGHDHTYERFARQSPRGVPDNARGMRQFVVGTGGASAYEFTNLGKAPNSDFRLTGKLGVLVLELYPGQYRWAFVTTNGDIRDTGSGSCH